MTDPEISDGSHVPSLNSTLLATPFDERGTYGYELSVRGGTTGQMTWTVADVTAGESTVAFHYEFAGETVDRTLTDDPRTIATRLLDTSAAPFLELVVFPSILLFAERDALSVGEQLSVPMPDGAGHAEITGTHVHAGREWYTSVWRYDDEMEYTDCMAPESGLVLHAEYYEPGETEALLGLALVEHDTN